MRIAHNYISLSVQGELDPEQVSRWRDVVSRIAPNGVPSTASIMVSGNPKDSEFYVRKEGNRTYYIVPLSRDLLGDEAARVALAWDRVCADGDFQIDFSQVQEARQRKSAMVDTVLDEISERAARLMHSEWVNDRVSEGWSYGPRYDQTSKRNPMLLPWDQLSGRRKMEETKRVKRLIGILEDINLRLVRK